MSLSHQCLGGVGVSVGAVPSSKVTWVGSGMLEGLTGVAHEDNLLDI